ncbi:MAG: hypothetical protein K9L73_06790, partial [Spirochaetia bacterium]|nr:hypothetical protein [Spirochaetia bacterium]
LLTGEEHAFWRNDQEVKTSFDPEADPVTSPRAEITQIPAARRRLNFEEVERPWYESEAIIQAQRCLRCDYGKPLRSAHKEDAHA